MSDRTSATRIDASLEALGRLCREARNRRRPVDMSPDAVDRRLRRVSQLRALCLYLSRMDKGALGSAPSADRCSAPLKALLATLRAGDAPGSAWLSENAARLGHLWEGCQDGVVMLTLLGFLRRRDEVVRVAERIVSRVEAAVPQPTVAAPLVATVRRWLADGGLPESEVAALGQSVKFSIGDYVYTDEYMVLGAQIHLFSMIRPETDVVEAAEKLANCAGLVLLRGRNGADAACEIAQIIRGSASPLGSSDLAHL